LISWAYMMWGATRVVSEDAAPTVAADLKNSRRVRSNSFVI
jgi:hypothetical protein